MPTLRSSTRGNADKSSGVVDGAAAGKSVGGRRGGRRNEETVAENPSVELSMKTPVVRLRRLVVNGVNTGVVEKPPPEVVPEEQVTVRRRKKRIRNGTPEVDEPPDVLENGSVLLPDVGLFPSRDAPPEVMVEKLRGIRDSVRRIFGEIMDQVQEDEDSLIPCYESVQRVYEFFDRSTVCEGWGDEERKSFGGKYRNVCVSSLWGFGAVVWKLIIGTGVNRNPFAERTTKFLEYCFVHLGWEADKRRSTYLSVWRDSAYQPASYSCLKLFYKYHCDTNAQIRQSQLSLLNKLLEIAEQNKNYEYIQIVWETVGKCVLIRLKDKSSICRVICIKILGYFVVLEDAAPTVQSTLKYYTRYDPHVEVRRLGTKILGEKTGIKLRFFFDQAFDKNEGVRVEAFKAMGAVGGEELVRGMGDISSDKVCKAIVWGASHSGAKCSGIVKDEILPKWLKMSCKNDLVQFLSNIDAYQHMKAVIRVLDLLLTSEDQERFVESIDLNFIEDLKANVKVLNYKPLSIESFVGWLGLCKASDVVQSIRGRVVPPADEMIWIIEKLQECVFLEHEEAKGMERNEDVSPVFCLVIGLEIGKRFVAWEEGSRRHFVQLLVDMLIEPLLDERVIVIQAINTLHTMIDQTEFEDRMMGVFQEVFDKASSSREIQRNGAGTPNNVSVENVNPDRSNPATLDPPPKKTQYELTKMREKLCDLKMKRLELQRRKQELIEEKMFIDAIPVNNQILEVQEEEAGLARELMHEESDFERLRVENRVGNEELLRRSMAVVDVERGGGGDEEDEEDGVGEKSGIISTVEEGLGKGVLMINAFLDLSPKICSFVRGIYECHVGKFMAENDVNLKVSVLQFLARIGMIDKREVRKVFCFLIRMMTSNVEVELRKVAFQCIVDVVVCYEYADFCLRDEEKLEAEELHPYIKDMTRYIEENLPHECVEYVNCTPEIMEKLTVTLLTRRFPPTSGSLTPMEVNMLNTAKNVGLLKLLVRGRLRDPVIISKILCLWVNQDYSGTVVLRDLEHVLKLYRTFEWWGDGGDGGVEEIDGEMDGDVGVEVRGGMMRVLGVAVGEGVLSLAQECGGGSGREEDVLKFVGYFVSFLEIRDQPLMRTIVQTILAPIQSNPARSYNSVLVRCASKVPITSPVSASCIVSIIGDVFTRMKEYPVTTSVSVLRRELRSYLGKLKRLFGDEIAVVKDRDGRERVVDNLGWEEEEEDEVERVGGDIASFSEEED